MSGPNADQQGPGDVVAAGMGSRILAVRSTARRSRSSAAICSARPTSASESRGAGSTKAWTRSSRSAIRLSPSLCRLRRKKEPYHHRHLGRLRRADKQGVHPGFAALDFRHLRDACRTGDRHGCPWPVHRCRRRIGSRMASTACRSARSKCAHQIDALLFPRDLLDRKPGRGTPAIGKNIDPAINDPLASQRAAASALF